jgi:hypothetical protein
MLCADISMLRSLRTAPDVGETRALVGSRLDWPNSLCADGLVADAAVIGTSPFIASPRTDAVGGRGISIRRTKGRLLDSARKKILTVPGVPRFQMWARGAARLGRKILAIRAVAASSP